MFYIISKLVAFFTEPLFWIAGFFILAFLLKKKKWRRLCFWGGVTLILFFGNGLIIEWVEWQYTNKYINIIDSEKVYEYALIQGGFGAFNPRTKRSQLNPSGERLVESIRLYKTGKVKKLFITGDGTFCNPQFPSSERAFIDYLHSLGVDKDDVLLDPKAQNTRQSALNSNNLLGAETCNHSLVVTCALHMPRAIKCYRKEGLSPIAYPTSIPVPFQIGITNFYLSSNNLSRWQFVLHEWIGLIAYRIVGYI